MSEDYDLISDEREWSDEQNTMINHNSLVGELGWEGRATYDGAHSKRSRQMQYEYDENN